MSEPDPTSRGPKWMLFVALLVTVPVPFYMMVVGGLVPTLCIIALAVRGLVVALRKFTGEGFFIPGILWAHVLILGGILYLLAEGMSRILYLLFPARIAFAVVIALMVSLAIASTFEIYRIPGHNSAPPADIFRILGDFLS